MSTRKFYAQGDILLELVEDQAIGGAPDRASLANTSPVAAMPNDPDGAVVLARGEFTGHRHAFYGEGVTLFRDQSLARDMAPGLYIGHVRIDVPTAELRHEEHATILLAAGTYRVRRQQEWEGDRPQLIWE